MYVSTVALLLAATGVRASVVLAQRAPAKLAARDIVQGWSLQSPAPVSGLTDCQNGSYCPSSLHCNPAANDEVAACCSSPSDCHGAVEGSPKCADSSWYLYFGYMGNGFCCEGGLVGVYDTSKNVAGTCVAADDVGSLHTAILTSSGTGAAATSAASSAPFVKSSVSKFESSVSSSSSKASAKTTATSTGSSSTGSSTGTATSSSSKSTATGNGAEKVGLGFGIVGVAFLAVAAL